MKLINIFGYLTYCDHLVEAILMLTTACYTFPIIISTKIKNNALVSVKLIVLANYFTSNVQDD